MGCECHLTHNKPGSSFELRQNGARVGARLKPGTKGPAGFVAVAREFGAVEGVFPGIARAPRLA